MTSKYKVIKCIKESLSFAEGQWYIVLHFYGNYNAIIFNGRTIRIDDELKDHFDFTNIISISDTVYTKNNEQVTFLGLFPSYDVPIQVMYRDGKVGSISDMSLHPKVTTKLLQITFDDKILLEKEVKEGANIHIEDSIGINPRDGRKHSTPFHQNIDIEIDL